MLDCWAEIGLRDGIDVDNDRQSKMLFDLARSFLCFLKDRVVSCCFLFETRYWKWKRMQIQTQGRHQDVASGTRD